MAAPFFARWLQPEQASRAAEWAVRIVLAYCSDPEPATDLTDPERVPVLSCAPSCCRASSPFSSDAPADARTTSTHHITITHTTTTKGAVP